MLKDANGDEVATWTTTNEEYVIENTTIRVESTNNIIKHKMFTLNEIKIIEGLFLF